VRRLLIFTAAVAGLLTITPPAQAKFNVRISIGGPSLEGPVELFNPEIDIGCVFSRPCDSTSRPPAMPLGPRYMVTQSLEGHHARGLMMDRILHDLYPYAPEGPWVFTAAGQTWHEWNRLRRTPGGWTRAPRSLLMTLRANGLPAVPPVARVANATIAAEERQGRGRGAVGALVGVGVLLAGGAFLGRPRRKNRSPGA
jgi:hypothetical protein